MPTTSSSADSRPPSHTCWRSRRRETPVARAPRTPFAAQVGLIKTAGRNSSKALQIWEHSAGVSIDNEDDEVFVVLSGRATISLRDGSTLEIGPGDVGILRAGEQTTWQVHEDLRKVYLTGVRPRRDDIEDPSETDGGR